MALFPGPMPQEGTHVRLGYGASCPGPSVLHRKPGPFVNRRETLPHTRLGVWLRSAQAAERTCSEPRMSCAESTVPASRVKPANSSEITQDSTCGTSLSLAQCTGGQHRLRLEKRGGVRSREETPAGCSPKGANAVLCILPLARRTRPSVTCGVMGMEMFAKHGPCLLRIPGAERII